MFRSKTGKKYRLWLNEQRSSVFLLKSKLPVPSDWRQVLGKQSLREILEEGRIPGTSCPLMH